MQPLKNVSPPSDRVLYVFYDFETTQNTRHTNRLKCTLVCMQQFSSRFESVDDVEQDSSGTKHSFWDDHVDISVNRDPGSIR